MEMETKVCLVIPGVMFLTNLKPGIPKIGILGLNQVVCNAAHEPNRVFHIYLKPMIVQNVD